MGRLLLVLALSLAVAGCGGDGEDAGTSPSTTETVPTATEPEPTTAGPQLGAECTSEEGGYAVSYPEDWHEEGCTFFDAEPFEVPEGTEFFDVAVLVSREPVPLDVLAGDDRTREILDLEETQIAGRNAVRLEAETTGEGLLDRGVRFYLVGVEVDDDAVILSTYALGALDFEGNKEVVDRMAESLELTR
ncbi:MAG: hypothetical protein ICV67_05620 [Thermoleophilia bacterium]|nr:hypothetical protein [Thermoleophilia bacterium]